MRTFIRRGLLGLLAVVAGGAGFLALKQPAQRPAPQVRAGATPERLARGQYLVEHVSACLHCHSEGEEGVWGKPAKAGLKGAGGMCLTEAVGFPGTLCTTNLTADETHGLGSWTDGEVLRALREGVSRDGHALVPFMPYDNYRAMSEEDALSVVAYLRTLAPVPRQVPAPQLPLPMEVALKFHPEPLAGPVAAPQGRESADRGRYLVTLASCRDCHTQVNARHELLPGRDFGGGREFPLAGGGRVVSPNITPHADGLGPVSRETFIALFKAHAPGAAPRQVRPEDNTEMPWLAYAGMREEDLGSIYDFLRTVAPLPGRVESRPARLPSSGRGTP
jgi:mono/diheme cytochrome c family protein